MMERYSRQMLFQPIGAKGQQKLTEKHVVIIGGGALGTGNAETLVRAGVGRVTIIDRDFVELSNLQRQQLYAESDALERLPKAVAAEQRLQAINSAARIKGIVDDVAPYNIEDYIAGADLVLDATDNFEIRMLINDACHKHGIPWIYGACVGSYGLTMTIVPGKTPCLHCLLKAVPLGGATCDTVGVIAPAVQMVTAHQTVEALKILVEDFASLRPTLVSFELWSNQHSSINVQKMKKDSCPTCGNSPTYPYLTSEEYLSQTTVMCGRNSVQISPPHKQNLDFDRLEETLGMQGKVERNKFLLSFSVNNYRLTVFPDGRSIIQGTQDVSTARTLYNRYIGG